MRNSETDVQRRWLCAVLTSRSDLQDYVDIRFLPTIVQYQ